MKLVRNQILTFHFKMSTLANEKKHKPAQLGTFYRCWQFGTWQPEKAWRKIHRSGGRSSGIWREVATTPIPIVESLQ